MNAFKHDADDFNSDASAFFKFFRQCRFKGRSKRRTVSGQKGIKVVSDDGIGYQLVSHTAKHSLGRGRSAKISVKIADFVFKSQIDGNQFVSAAEKEFEFFCSVCIGPDIVRIAGGLVSNRDFLYGSGFVFFDGIKGPGKGQVNSGLKGCVLQRSAAYENSCFIGVDRVDSA